MTSFSRWQSYSKGGIEESFINSNLTRVPIIMGTNKDENKFLNSLNRNFVKWGPATGMYKTVGIDEMPIEILDLITMRLLIFMALRFGSKEL